MAACCGLAGAVSGCFVGWLYGRDQSLTAAGIPWYGVGGSVLGLLLGLLISLPPAVVLLALLGRGWASGPVCVVLAALAAAVPITLFIVLASAFYPVPEVLLFCLTVTAVPAGVVTGWLTRSSR